jgi:hypothetical protein
MLSVSSTTCLHRIKWRFMSATVSATLASLDGRARHRTVGAEHTAIASFRLEPRAAALAVIEKLAGVRRAGGGNCPSGNSRAVTVR